MLKEKSFQYVKTLAREGSFSRAAESLRISQPSLSQYVMKLEKQLGIPLFERGKGEIKLTEAGRLYLETGESMRELEQRFMSQLADLAGDKRGSLIIGTAPFRSASMMPRAVRQFHKSYPGIQLIIREGTTRELTEGLEAGTYDLCLSVLPVDGSRFAWEKVMDEELLLAVPADYPPLPAVEQEGLAWPALHVRDLEGLSFVSLTREQIMQQTLERISREQGLSLTTAAVVKSLEAQIAMVKAGVGVALAPAGVQVFCGKDEVRFYSFCQPRLTREVAVIWRRNKALSRRARALKQVICEMDW